MSTITVGPTPGRDLVSAELFELLVNRVALDDGYDPDVAVRVVDQALAFLGACAVNRNCPLSPSGMVDSGWHAFLLHTRDYHAFGDRVAGCFIHHVPTGAPGSCVEAAAAMRRSVLAIAAAGYLVDADLWRAERLDCTGCHNGCHDDPPPARPSQDRSR